MKKFVIAMVVIILLGAVLTGIGCAVFFSSDWRLDSGNVEYYEKSFETEDAFSTIDLRLGNAHNVTLQRGEQCSVKYFDTNYTEFTISVQNRALVISENGWSWKNWLQRLFYKFRSTDVIITVPDGVKVEIVGSLKGAVNLNLPSWEYGNIDLEVSGVSTIVATDVNASSIALEVAGSATMTLSGKTNSVKINASGSVVLRSDNLNCPLVNVHCSGSANVNLSGTGSALNLDVSGSGKVKARDFALDRAHIESSGSVDAEHTVSTYLKADTSGSSHISYWGDPQIEKSTSGSSSIVKKG